jgi:uncharacterized membrane protein (DUF2068 family)
MASKNKPFGITATAVYAAFAGILYLPIGSVLLLAGNMPEGVALFTAAGILLLTLGVLMLASVYGLWSLQEWGRTLSKWLAGISILLGIASIFPIWPKQQFTISNTVLQLVGIGVAILIIVYLSKPHIKSLFNETV